MAAFTPPRQPRCWLKHGLEGRGERLPRSRHSDCLCHGGQPLGQEPAVCLWQRAESQRTLGQDLPEKWIDKLGRPPTV